MDPQNYRSTIRSCFTAYVVQGIINHFAPLLFVLFQRDYRIPLEHIALMISVNFGVQLLTDLLSVGFVDRIGYRASMVLAHLCAVVGFVCLAVLPDRMDPVAGLMIAVVIYAVGGGLLEVLVSPIVEACPSDHKSGIMSLLHSFYCWGHVGVVLISTLFFAVFGIANWRILALLWAVIPLWNAVVLSRVPMPAMLREGEAGLTVRQLLGNRLFPGFLLLMFCAGAFEHSVAQWASAFAEQGLGISKTLGDLAGPMAFAVMMGLSRLLYGKYGGSVRLDRFMVWSGAGCLLSCLLIGLVPHPMFGLLGCALSGLCVGILWPGTFSLAAASIRGGTAMFAFFALAGDLGCSLGPGLVGWVSGQANGNLRIGLLTAAIFPTVILLTMANNAVSIKKHT